MWQRNSLTFIASLFLAATTVVAQDAKLTPVTDVKEISPREDLRVKLFKDTLKTPSCGVIQTDPRGGLAGLDAELDGFVKLIIKAIKEKNDKAIQPLFHKRLNVGLDAIANTYAKLDQVYGAPLDVSIYRLWALNTVDGSPKPLNCVDDRLAVTPHYGYPLQFALWLQVMGQKELGRIYVSLVPADGRWNIGAFHQQQWTHNSQDFASWAEEAQKNFQMGYKETAYLRYDLAVKLLDGAGFLEVTMRDDLIKARDAVMTPAQWDAAVKKGLESSAGGFEVGHVATLLVTDGAGILARYKIPKEISTEDVKNHCRSAAEALAKQQWATYLNGMRCSYIMPSEDVAKEGALGGIYISIEEIRQAMQPTE